MLKPEVIQYGEKGILLSWANKIDDSIRKAVLSYQNHIEEHFSQSVQETNIGYQSLLVLLTNDLEVQSLIFEFTRLEIEENVNEKIIHYLYHIPVCYHPKFGIDIESLAATKNLSVTKIVTLHTSQTYKVYFTGFLPGFLYLGGLPSILNAPRHTKPRLKVKKGSVAIGGNQTGIYPQNSPGGWHILGQTPINLFDISKSSPSIFNPDDYIKFYDVSINEFEKILDLIKLNEFDLRREVLND